MSVFIVLLCLFYVILSQTDFNYIGSFKQNHPSFLELMHTSNNDNNLDLIITFFDEFGEEGIMAYNNIGNELNNIANGVQPESILLTDNINWPNYVYESVSGIFPAEKTLICHGGFLTPGHGTGNIYALLLNNSKPINLIELLPKQNDCYYHNSTQIDMDGDGKIDLLFAQTCKHAITQQNEGHLLWAKQPSNPTTPHSWQTSHLVNGPDILITTQYINDTSLIIYASEFFNAQLVYYILNFGTNTPNITYDALIDNSIGAVYQTQLVDIFKNNELVLLVNDHVGGNGTNNGVWIYEFPPNFPSVLGGEFKKTQIASGFNTTNSPGAGAPGFIYPFNIMTDSNKPYNIAIAGDGNYFAYELTLIDENTKTYSKNIIRTIPGTCGTLAIGDVNNDGYNELFMPFYEDGIVYVYTTNPNNITLPL